MTGTVTFGSKPVKGAWVAAEGEGAVAPAQTDGQGHFALQGVWPGTYRLHAESKEGAVESASRRISVASGSRLTVDLAIPKGAVIAGRVIDRNKQPVAGVFVRALTKSADAFAVRLRGAAADRTNDLGEFRIAHLPPGAYVLSVTPKPVLGQRKGAVAPAGMDYPAETFYPGVTDLAGATTLELHPGEEQSSLDIVIDKRPSQCVTFRAGSGFASSDKPDRPSTRVIIGPWFGPRVIHWGRELDKAVRGSEVTRVCGLPAGDYRLELATDYSRADIQDGDYRAHLVGYLSVPFTVKNEELDLGSLDVPGSTRMNGTVKVKDALPGASLPEGLQVRLVSTESPLFGLDDGGIGNVRANGAFELPKVFVTDYGVRISGLPAGYYIVDAMQQGRSVRNGGFQLGGGDLQIVLSMEGATISGRVTAPDGAPMADAAVVLSREDGDRPMVVRTDQSGAYRFLTGLAPGKYKLMASASLMEGQEEDAGALLREAAAGGRIELSARESKIIDLKIPVR
jgi:protocatechuate 3,4-dioxygenase beta subunit